MRVIFHIGWHKTGTTSIQEFLNSNRQRLIENHGIYYPEEGLLYCAHHYLVWSIQNKKESPWGIVPSYKDGADGCISMAIEKANSLGCNAIIFSSEEFCTLKKGEIETLGVILKRYFDDVTIVSYIRRQDLIVESAYNMQVKWWGVRSTGKFEDFAKQRHGFPNYFDTLGGWDAVFGINSMKVRVFNRKLLPAGDARIDFCQIIGIDSETLMLPKEESNDSLGATTSEFIRVINNLNLTRAEHDRVVSKLLQYDLANNSTSCVYFDVEQRKKFLSSCVDSNSKLVKYGVDVKNMGLDSDSIPEKNVYPLSMDDFVRMLRFCGLCDQPLGDIAEVIPSEESR